MAAAALALAAARRGSSGSCRAARAAGCLSAAWRSLHHGEPELQAAAALAAAVTRSPCTAPPLPALQQLAGQLPAMSGQSWQQRERWQQQRINSSSMAATPLCLRQYSTQSGNSARHVQKQQQAVPPLPPPGVGKQPPPPLAALQAAGWTRREVLNVPNALSMLRLLSGPLIASWILDAQWSLALPALVLSGATDWADGYAARRFNQQSVIGTYLDPLADKVLICCVVGALGWSSVLPGPVVGIIVGRDVILVGAIFVVRAKTLGWRWPGAAEFFRISGPPASNASSGDCSSSGVVPGAGGVPASPPLPQEQQQQAAAFAEAGVGGSGGASSTAAPTAGGTAAPAPVVKPLFVSKVNTVFQLGLVGTCLLHSWLGWPGEEAILTGSVLTAGTTLWTCGAYLQAYRQGRVLAPSGGGTAAAAGRCTD